MKNVIWSPSSWALWKTCPEKYRLKKFERWSDPYRKTDKTLAKLAVPGLVVDKIMKYWLYRNDPDDIDFFDHLTFAMFWESVIDAKKPFWSSDAELEVVWDETWQGLQNAVKLLRSLDLHKYHTFPQVWFHEKLTEGVEITGAPDLMLRNKETGECLIIDFKNSHSRNNRLTGQPLYLYLMGLEKATGEEFSKVGYLYFNPRINGWHWYNVYDSHKEALTRKLEAATQDVLDHKFEYKWNAFSCSRFCEVRFSCQIYQDVLGTKIA